MDTKKITQEDFDYIIIGGGIVGAGIFRDLSLHGKKVLLLEREDFASQTSQGSSKMLHGGIRYLENLDFGLVFEALKEKNLWIKLAPNLAKEVPFYLPVYKESKWPLFFLRIGLFIYDLLSLFKNTSFKTLNKDETLTHIPGLKSKHLSGSGIYYDGIIDDAKLALNCILDAKADHAHALNYMHVKKVEDKGSFQAVYASDKFSNEEFQFYGKEIIFATGPFTDQVMKDLEIPWTPVILPSKGTHLWVKKESLPIKNAMVLQTKDQRIIFVIPQRDAILVGTTEIPLDANQSFLNIKPTQEEIDYLLKNLKEYFPNTSISRDIIISSFAAVRPLVKEANTSSKTSRKHKIYSPKKHIHVIVGGKYTTFRRMAQDLCKRLLGNEYNSKLSLNPLKNISLVNNPSQTIINTSLLKKIIDTEQPKTIDDLIIRRLSYLDISEVDDITLEAIKKLELN